MLYLEIPADLTLGTLFAQRDDAIYLISETLPPPIVVQLYAGYTVLDYVFSESVMWQDCTYYTICCKLDKPYDGPRTVKTGRIGFYIKETGFGSQPTQIDIWSPNLPHIPSGSIRVRLGSQAPISFHCDRVERLDYEHYIIHGFCYEDSAA